MPDDVKEPSATIAGEWGVGQEKRTLLPLAFAIVGESVGWSSRVSEMARLPQLTSSDL